MKKNDIADVLKQLDEIPLPDKEKVLSFCLQQADSGGRALPAKRGRRPGSGRWWLYVQYLCC